MASAAVGKVKGTTGGARAVIETPISAVPNTVSGRCTTQYAISIDQELSFPLIQSLILFLVILRYLHGRIQTPKRKIRRTIDSNKHFITIDRDEHECYTRGDLQDFSDLSNEFGHLFSHERCVKTLDTNSIEPKKRPCQGARNRPCYRRDARKQID
jgi:hypothetical protein